MSVTAAPMAQPTATERSESGAAKFGLLRLYYRSLAGATAFCFMAAVAITFTITCTRYLIAFSDPTAEYLSRYFVILGTFLGFPLAVLHGLNVRFDLLDFMLAGRVRRIVHFCGLLLSMASCGVFAWAGVALVEESYLFGEVMPTGFDLPLWIPHASVALGMALGVVSYAIVAVQGRLPTIEHAAPAPIG